MQRSIIVLLGSFAVLGGCNLSSTIGSNNGTGGASDTGGSGGTGSQTGTTQSNATATSGTQSSGTQSGTPSTGTQAGSTTSTGGGPVIQGAHVYVHVDTSQSWIQDSTVIDIHASAAADPNEFLVPSPVACNVAQVPSTQAPGPNFLDLSGAHAVVTAQGFGSVDAIWSASQETLYAQFNQALPAGTPIHVAFDATSSLLPSESIDLASQNFALSAPQPTQVLTYQNGSNWAFDWSSAPMPYVFSGFVVPGNSMNPPPPQMWRAWCAGDGSASAVTVPSNVMAGLVSDMQSQGQGATIWVSLVNYATGPQEQPQSGNFVSTGALVAFSRPVVVAN